MSKKALLMILDGWGIGDKKKDDVIFNTPTPYWDSLIAKYPNSQLEASGENVGLPDGQMGNSEVGHLNIGAGRIVYQDLVKINIAGITYKMYSCYTNITVFFFKKTFVSLRSKLKESQTPSSQMQTL